MNRAIVPLTGNRLEIIEAVRLVLHGHRSGNRGENLAMRGAFCIRRSLSALAALAALAWGTPGQAADQAIVSEFRGGILANDVAVFGRRKEDGGLLNLELLFTAPSWSWWRWAGAPRPHVGLSGNVDDNTSQLYGGLTWRLDFLRVMFVEGSLGFSVHDGKLDANDPKRKDLGSRVLLRESLSLGARLGQDSRHSLSLMLDHISNAGLADKNDGLDTFGLRYGYRF